MWSKLKKEPFPEILMNLLMEVNVDRAVSLDIEAGICRAGKETDSEISLTQIFNPIL